MQLTEGAGQSTRTGRIHKLGRSSANGQIGNMCIRRKLPTIANTEGMVVGKETRRGETLSVCGRAYGTGTPGGWRKRYCNEMRERSSHAVFGFHF